MKRADAAKRQLERLVEAARDAGPRFDWVLGAGLGLAALILYLSARNVFYGFDPLFYAEAVESGTAKRLLHPHHLLYNPTCWLAYGGARLFGFGGRAVAAMHVVNALAGGVGVFFMFALCRRLGARRWASLLAVVGLATAAGYWATAAGVSVHLPGTAAALAALYVTATATRARASRAAVAGVVCAGAALFDQINFLLAPAALAYVIFTAPAPRRRVLAFAAGYAAAVAIGYVAFPAALLRLETPRAYADWFFAFTLFKRWGSLSWGNLGPGSGAFARAFYVSVFWDNFAAPFIKADIRHLRVALPLWLGVVFCGANLLLWLGRGPGRRALTLLAGSSLLYAVFALWWIPDYVDFWLVPAACCLVAVGLAVSGRGRRRYGISLLAFAVAWLGITNVNWRNGIKPRTRLEANADYRAGVALAEFVPSDAFLYLAPFPVIPHARYFGGLKKARTPNWAVNVFGGDGEKAARRIENLIRPELDKGRSVYVGDRAFPGIGGPPLRDLGERLLAKGHPVGSYAGADVSETIYVITPEASDF